MTIELEIVSRLFPRVERLALSSLAKRVTRVELDVGFVTLNQQAAMCLERGVFESGKGTEATWAPFWTSEAGTTFNTAALHRRAPPLGMIRVVKPATVMMLLVDDFEAALVEDATLAALLRPKAE